MSLVLIVNSEKKELLFWETFLKSLEGLEVLTASNGLQAIDIFMNNKPEIVITGLDLIHYSGIEVISKIRKSGFQATIVVVSDQITVNIKKNNRQLQVDYWYEKTSHQEDLLNFLQKTLAAAMTN